MHAERLLQSICVSSLVLTAQAISLLGRGQTNTDRQTHMTECPTHAGGIYTAGVGKYNCTAKTKQI